jgi:hypothetical protein
MTPTGARAGQGERKKSKERKRGVVSTQTKDALFLAASLIFVAGFVYFVVLGVHYRDRALSRASAIAFLLSLVMAIVFLVRLIF